MQLIRLFALIGVLLVPCLGLAGPKRTPMSGTPIIVGRELPRLILMQPVLINRRAPGLTNRDMLDRLVGQMLAGQLVPVSEDAKGVYYQSTRGFQREGMTSSVPAGLYVSKTKPNTIFAYTGEAREPGEELMLDIQPLSSTELAKLKVGAPAAKGAK